MIDIEKVREVWDEHKQVAIDLRDGEFDNYSPYIKLGLELISKHNIVNEALTELERLQGKEELAKVIVKEYECHSRKYCPKCDYYFGYVGTIIYNTRILQENYCPHCGQKLDWSDEK